MPDELPHLCPGATRTLHQRPRGVHGNVEKGEGIIIVPFKSLLVGGGRGFFVRGFCSGGVGKLPRRERLDRQQLISLVRLSTLLARCTNSSAYCRYILLLTEKKMPQLLFYI